MSDRKRTDAEVIAAALRLIAHGDVSGPGGLESVAMALAGDGLRQPVGAALNGIADSLDGVAEGLQAIAAAIRASKGEGP